MRNLNLSTNPDVIYWSLRSSSKFSTKSVWLESSLAGCDYGWIWNSKVPFKNQIFLWQLSQDSLLATDGISSRNWPGNPRCSFCKEQETSQHLFFLCPHARVLWRSVGAVSGTNLCPNNMYQYFSWIYSFLPEHEKVHTIG